MKQLRTAYFHCIYSLVVDTQSLPAPHLIECQQLIVMWPSLSRECWFIVHSAPELVTTVWHIEPCGVVIAWLCKTSRSFQMKWVLHIVFLIALGNE